MVNLKSDCTPEPAEGIFWHPGPPDGRILMPAAVVVAGGFPSDPAAPPRCKALRMAMIGRARDKGYKPKPGSNPAVKALLSDGFWERITIEATVLHLALVRNDAAVTVDVVARFKDGRLAFLAVWPEDRDRLINPSAPWAELGAGVAAAADRGLMVDKVGLIWAGEKVKLEAADPNKALGLWCDAVDLHRFYERRKLAVAA